MVPSSEPPRRTLRSEIEDDAREPSPDFLPKQAVGVAAAAQESAGPAQGIAGGQHHQRPAQVSPMAAALELDQQGRDMAAHIGKNLLRQGVEGPPVVVEDHRRGLVAAAPAGGEHAIPVLRVARASRGADVESFVEQADRREDRPAERHVGAGTDFPGGTAARPMAGEEVAVEIDAPKAAAEAPLLLEDLLPARVEL